MTDVRPLASRTARSGNASPSLPSRGRSARTENVANSGASEAFLAGMRDSAGDDAGVDESTLSTIEERLRNV